MAKVRSIGPRLSSLGARVNTLSRRELEQARHYRRDDDQPWRRWYKTARWQKLRLSVLMRDQYTCQDQDCGRVEGDTSRLVCDHVEPHGGDPELFWNGPFQTLCKDCHDGKKQRIDRAGKKAAFFPEWLRPSRIPLVIVCGAPASGKSYYVSQRLGLNDLVIDLDVIASELSGEPLHGWNADRWLHPALFKRNDLLGRISGRPRERAAWFIVTAAKAKHRQWWADKLQPEQIVVLETSEQSCLANALRDDDRDQAVAAASIRHWWRDYEPRAGDKVVRTS